MKALAMKSAFSRVTGQTDFIVGTSLFYNSFHHAFTQNTSDLYSMQLPLFHAEAEECRVWEKIIQLFYGRYQTMSDSFLNFLNFWKKKHTTLKRSLFYTDFYSSFRINHYGSENSVSGHFWCSQYCCHLFSVLVSHFLVLHNK